MRSNTRDYFLMMRETAKVFEDPKEWDLALQELENDKNN